MAFATSQIQLGSTGDGWVLRGSWTGSEGDASGTVSVGGLVSQVSFQNHDATSNEDRPTPCDISRDSTTGISTITVHNHSTVSVGRFAIHYK